MIKTVMIKVIDAITKIITMMITITCFERSESSDNVQSNLNYSICK